MTYMMRGFGLRISSDFPLAQMRKATDTGDPDVRIVSAPAPSELVREPVKTWPDCILGRKEMWTEIENVVRLYAANGNEIRVERLFTDPAREGEMRPMSQVLLSARSCTSGARSPCMAAAWQETGRGFS